MKPEVVAHGTSRRHSFVKAYGSVWSRPVLFSVFGVFGCLLLWLVLTKSLPLVWAKTNSELASRLAPEHPAVLLALAESQRRRLVELISTELAKEQKLSKATSETTAAGRYAAPSIVPDGETSAVDREALRTEIRILATQILKQAPLSARAHRLLAEVSEEEETVRKYMLAAFHRSRRETTAAFWLLNDSFQKKDIPAVLNYADVILRTKGRLAPLIMSYLGQLATDRESRGLLAEMLATNPTWRGTFFRNLPKSVPDPKTPLLVLLDLKGTPHPVTDAELKPYLDKLLRDGRAELAYSAWLQHLPAKKLTNLGLLTNAGFDEAPSGLPFNWIITNRRYARIEPHAKSDKPDNKALHLSLGGGRIKFGEVRQVLMLAPGTYRISGLIKGLLKGRRGFRWQLRCMKVTGDALGQSEMLFGQSATWAPFSFEAVVPNIDTCRAQELRLFHHARSASEELIFGEIWFDDLRLQKAGDTAQDLLP